MDPRRAIPSVDRLLASAPFAELSARLPRTLIAGALQRELEAARSLIAAGEPIESLEPAALAQRIAEHIFYLQRGTLVPVLNATGVILHTNLGRAPLARAAIEAVQHIAHGYSNLEYDLATGARGSRYAHARALLLILTGAEDALVVNNNAAALVLALNTLARGREAVISRGELVEIGGAFRVPEIMARSGAQLREVGATNRTHLRDYRDAVSERTGVVLKVHPSNFTMAGYTAEVSVAELGQLARERGLPLIHDVGSGSLLEPATLGLSDEPWVVGSLQDGASVVTMSGDKLLGGPQCGIIAGEARLIERMRHNPLCRALRVDKLTLAALEATLRLYLEPERARREIPTLAMLLLDSSAVAARAAALSAQLCAGGLTARVVNGSSAVGGGASPAAMVPTALLQIEGAAQLWQTRLRQHEPIVITRVVDERLTLDLRTIPPDVDDVVLTALRHHCR